VIFLEFNLIYENFKIKKEDLIEVQEMNSVPIVETVFLTVNNIAFIIPDFCFSFCKAD